MVGSLINDEWERSLKEVLVSLFKILSWNWGKLQKISVKTADILAKI
jgi:hypothetical protein